MNIAGKKIKILTATKDGWYMAVDKAKNIGCYSNDGDVMFNPEKPAMVIDDGAIMSSRLDYEPKKLPYDKKFSLSGFLSTELHFEESSLKYSTKHLSQPADCYAVIVDTIKAASDVYQAKVSPRDYLEPSIVIVPKAQHEVIFKTKGIKYLQDRGVNFEESDGTFYHLDLKANTAEAVTSQWVVNKGKQDLLDKEDSAFAMYLLDFELVESMTFTRIKEDTVGVSESTSN